MTNQKRYSGTLAALFNDSNLSEGSKVMQATQIIISFERSTGTLLEESEAKEIARNILGGLK